MMRRRIAVVLAAALLVGGVAGCGHQGQSGGSNDRLTAAEFHRQLTDAMASADTAHFTMTAGISSAKLKMVGDLKGVSGGTVAAMRMRMNVAGQRIEEILLDKTLYFQSNELTNSHWVKVDLSDPHNPLGKMLSSSSSPGAFTGSLDAVQAIKDEGHATMSGESTERYLLKVNTQKAQQANPMVKNAQMKAALKALPKTTKVTIWVDQHNLPVKFTESLGQLGTYSMTFSHWGEPVSIKPPPRRQVTTLPSH